MNQSNIIPFKKPFSLPSLEQHSPQKELVEAPAHYVEGRTIEPIDVIESWHLNHLLACVVKYIARCGRKNNALLDLQKAHWYLNRELNKSTRSFMTGEVNKDLVHLPHEIAKDWKLSPNLAFVLVQLWYDTLAQNPTQTQYLKIAEESLTQEIYRLKQHS